MSLRRGLALGVAVVALATVTPSATAAPGARADRADGKPTICVALIVDGRSLGSDVSTACAKVPRGATGLDVLQAAGHRVGFRSDGLLCTIDGLPKSGCADVDDTHYWAYFHRAPGSTKWTYSSEGPSTYQPANKSTEGWVYDDGTSLTPDNVPYAHICPPTTSPSPTPSTHRTPSPAPTPTPTASRPAATPSPSTRSHRHHRHPAKTAADLAAASASAVPTRSPSTQLAGAVSAPASGHGWVGLVVGLVVVVALGGLAAWRFRRARGTP